MKLEALNLIAYGPFTGRRLEFSGPFTIVYGPNEAGKTSALRALGDGLFGIPGQTPDAFLHPYGNLRIELVLTAGGDRFAFIRRKGRTQTLRAPDDLAVVPDSALDRVLQGLTRETFETMFGISHEALVRGGRDLALGRGEVGQLLFASAAGMGSLQATLADLDRDAGELYAPRATSKSIHQSLRNIRDAEQELRHAQLGIAKFQENQKALEEVVEKLAGLDARTEDLRREAERLARLRQAIPTISARKQVLSHLQQCSGDLLLDADFGNRLGNAERELDAAKEMEAGCKAELQRIADAIAALHVPADLLAEDDSIRKLFEQKSAIEKSKQDCTRREAELAQLQRALIELVERLKPGLTLDDAARLEPGIVVRKRVQELASAAPELAAQIRSLTDALESARGKLAQVEQSLAELPAIPDTTALAALVNRAHREPDFGKVRKLRLDIQAREQNLDASLAALPFWKGTAEDFERLPVPAAETIEEFRASQQDLAAAEKSDAEKLRQIEETLVKLRVDRDAVVAMNAVPSIASLREVRAVRDMGWTAVKRVWRDGQADAPEQGDFLAQTGAADLATGYESAVSQADQVADRMREEAKRVERLTLLDAGIRGEEERRAKALEATAQTAEKAQAWASRWREAWSASGLAPDSPSTMLVWMRRRDTILAEMAELRQLRLELQALESAEAAITAELRVLLAPHGPVPESGAADLLDASEATLNRAQQAAQQRRNLAAEKQMQTREIARLEGNLKDTRQGQADWKRQWGEAMQQIGLPAESSPAAAEEYLNGVREIEDKLRAVAELENRIEKMRADAAVFAAAVSSLVAHVRPDLARLEPEAAIVQLYQALLAGNEDRKLLERERKRQREYDEKLRGALQTTRRRTAELEALLREAGAPDPQAARACWERSNRRRELEQQLAECNQRLLLVSAGKAIADFLTDAETVDPDSIAGRLEEIERNIAEIKRQRVELEERRRSLDAEALAMRGGDQAALLAQRISGYTGKLAADVEQYVRLKTASFLLRKAIERYRDRNQGPVLERAARLFAQLTCDSFAGLRVESIDGESVLRGVRSDPGSQSIAVPEMSDGTRDQLFLALRIASLEHYFEAHEAVPFIVDDVLLNFDDDRAEAALSALDGLSGRGQVVFFTHHQHLVELARKRTRAAVSEL